MVDREIFSRRLEALRGYLDKLAAFREVGEDEFVREAALHDLAERYLHLAVEASLDLANHRIAARGLRTPDANRDTFTVLEEAGELSGDLAERLRGWAGFGGLPTAGARRSDWYRGRPWQAAPRVRSFRTRCRRRDA
jgi:uncharacterized protein YutE (UPF0331/DUF86 family)